MKIFPLPGFFVASQKFSLDRNNLEAVIEKHSEELEKLTLSIPGHFQEKDIHDYRVAYKKLRAFLRMVTAHVPDHLPLMTEEFKKLYNSSGRIRDLQLYISSFGNNFPDSRNNLPVYHDLLARELFTAKEDFIKRSDIFSFAREKERWLIMPPEYLTTHIIKRFLQQRVTAMRLILLAPDDDESLHSLRKHVKDIMYAIRLFTNTWGIAFPVTAWKSEKKLNELAEELGAYNDRCNALDFLADPAVNELPSEEKNSLQNLQRQWLIAKNDQRKIVMQKISELKLNAQVKEI